LFQRLNGPDELPEVGERVVLPVELIVRRSCGCSDGGTAAGSTIVKDRAMLNATA
jgi:hypothetical protein